MFGEAHGHAISKHIRRTSDQVLQVETGSLYPALHRLEKQKLIESEWKHSEKGKRAKYYRLSAAGKERLTQERDRWEQMSKAIGQVLDSPTWSGLS